MLLDVVAARLGVMMLRLGGVPVRGMGVMGGVLVVPLFVKSGRFAMMFSRLLVMLGGLLVMFGAFMLRHGFSLPGRKRFACSAIALSRMAKLTEACDMRVNAPSCGFNDRLRSGRPRRSRPIARPNRAEQTPELGIGSIGSEGTTSC